MIGNDGGVGEEMVRGSGGRSFQRRAAVLDNDSAIIIISLAVLLNSARKGVGWRPQPIYRDSNKKAVTGERRVQCQCI